MNASDASATPDISLLDHVGGCFEAVAESFSLVRHRFDNKRGNQKVLERALPLIAEAQSALRAAFQRIGGPDDSDQWQAFEWLKATAARHHVYIKRFMRADDMADPSRWSDLLARIDALGAHDQESQQQRAQLNRLRDELKLVRESSGTSENWRSVFQAVEEMVIEGMPPSNREMRELLLPFLDDLPDVDDLPP